MTTARASVPGTAAWSPVLRWLRWVAAGVVVAAVVVAFTFLIVGGGSSDSVADNEQAARDLASYRDDLMALVEQGGSVVGMGVKPGLADIRDQRYPDNVLAGMADAWVSDLESVRADINALDPPESLAATHALYVRALDGYVGAAATLREAVAVTGDSRQQLLEKAAAEGRSADAVYDRAEESLARQESRLEAGRK